MRYLTFLVGGALLVWAQAPHRCGTDFYQAQVEAADPTLKAGREALEAALLQWYERNAPALRTENACPESDYVFPVVVHIIHSGNGASDSLPLSQVLLQMEQLFNDFRKRPYTKGYSSGVDTRIEFSLATKDPNGNAHSGVTYTHFTVAGLSESKVCLTSDGSAPPTSSTSPFTLKNNVGWPRNKYLNIWVVGKICQNCSNCPGMGNILGFATFPDNNSDVNEGVVVAAWVFGNTGGGQTSTHEIGHYLNLYHTFQGGCAGMVNTNCASGGDRVCDTPPTANSSGNFGGARRQNTCTETTTATGGDRPDQVRNYMDYLDDLSLDIFTEGQRARMTAALNNATDRNTQYTSPNLQATGAGPWGRIKANFALNGCEQPPCYACPGQQLTFSSYSWGKPNQFLWEIRQGTTVISSSTSGPCVTLTAPSTPDTYSVRLQVTNQAGSADTLYSNFLIVRDPAQAASYPFSEGFEGTVFPPAGWVRINPDFNVGGTLVWERWSSTGRGSFGASNAMVRIRNFNYFNRTQRDHLITPLINIPTNASSPAIEFDVYYRALNWTSTANNNKSYLYGDTLAVYISSDCGNTWQQLYYKGGEDLDVTGTAIEVSSGSPGTAHQAVPPQGSNTAWRHEVISIPAAYKGQKVLIRFENISEMGNNLYLDSIQVRENTSTTTATAGIHLPSVTLSPNPTLDESFLTIRHGAGQAFRYRIVSLLGQTLAEGHILLDQEEQRLSLPTAQLSAGIYLVEATLGSQRWSFRLVRE